jgi:hypothetical protein
MRRGPGALVGSALVGVIAAAVTTGGTTGAVTAPAPPPVAIPLVSAVTTPAVASVALPMGDLGQFDDTFWELFVQPPAGTPWSLRTPPGVADNGGITVGASAAGPLTVGFMASNLLRFSPLARSTDGGSNWSPGYLPNALAAVPDALADGPAGISAVVGTGAAQLVLTGKGLSGWSTVASTRSLARVTGCAVRRITAVAPAPAAAGAVLGVQCAQPGRIGVLTPSPAAPGGTWGTTWSSVGPRLAGGATGTATVLRLESGGAGLGGLARVRAGATVALVAFWRATGRSGWSQSPALRVPVDWSVQATATGGGSGQGEAVLLASGDHRTVAEVAGPGAPWVTLPAPPSGTEALAVRGAATDAFTVSGSHLAVWSTTGSAGWSRTQAMTVPVPYGSSS